MIREWSHPDYGRSAASTAEALLCGRSVRSSTTACSRAEHDLERIEIGVGAEHEDAVELLLFLDPCRGPQDSARGRSAACVLPATIAIRRIRLLRLPTRFLEPGAQRAGGLMPQPQPRELNHDRASFRVTGLADTLITARLAALEMRGRQTDVARQLFAIVKRAAEQFTDKCGRKFGPDALDLGQIPDLFCAATLSLSLADAIVLIIPMTSSSRCSSCRISALSRDGKARPSAVCNCSSRCIRASDRDAVVGSHRCHGSRAVP
jgi:hypothetical protein